MAICGVNSLLDVLDMITTACRKQYGRTVLQLWSTRAGAMIRDGKTDGLRDGQAWISHDVTWNLFSDDGRWWTSRA
jgi:hypothetical protein